MASSGESDDLIAIVARPFEAIKSLVVDSVSSPHSKRAYDKALTDFLSWYQVNPQSGFTKAAVQKYRTELEGRGLAPSSVNLHLSALRKLALEAADNGLLPPELAAGIARVKGAKQSGSRVGNWLTHDQAERLINLPDPATLKGKRDRALLALLVGCGLRRNEVAGLTLERLQQREGRWVIVDLVGKGKRTRTVPMPGWAKVAIDQWAEAAGLKSGRIFRAINKGDRLVGQGMTPQSIFETVVSYGRQIGVPIAPHDLRRTFAKLAHKGRAAVEQIQLSLGHASLLTTEKYLGIRQDLSDAPCDHLRLNFTTSEDQQGEVQERH
jgi:integrase